MFYDNFLRLCNKKGISPTAAVVEMGFQKSVASRWKQSIPTDANKLKIAEYFGVTVEELMASNEEKPAGQEADELIKNDPLAGQLFAAYGKVKEEFSQAEIDDITMIMEMIAEKKRRKREKGEE